MGRYLSSKGQEVGLNSLVFEGVQLMAVGMGTVFTFLTILVIGMTLMSRTIQRWLPEPEVSDRLDDGVKPQHIAAISAALNQYEKDKLNKSL
jgi:oxaloacetate decarboxylase gamma subunit